MGMAEGALVFASIIVGLAVADQLISLHKLLQRRHAVRWDLLTLWVAALILLTLVQVWWGLAGRPAGTVTIGGFLPVLVTLVILFLLAAASLPDAVPDAGMDLRDFYAAQQSYIWTLYSLALGWLTLLNIVKAMQSGSTLASAFAQKGGDILIVAIMLSLIRVRSRWWQYAALLLLSTGPVGWLSRTIG